MPRGLRLLAIGLSAAAIAACGSEAQDRPSSAPPGAATTVAAPEVKRPANPPERTPEPDAAALVARAIAARLPAKTGVAVAPLADGPVHTAGARSPTAAWSTMKVPVIVTVLHERRAGALPGGTEPTTAERDAIRRAITASDNAAVQTLYAELTARYGGDRGATRRIDRMLRLAGDTRTRVNSRFSRPDFSNFGQTRWGLREIALFYRALAAGRLLGASDGELVIGAMGDVDANQRWGARSADWPGAGHALVKGGWGPTVDGAYDVLQAAIVPGDKGFVFALATVAPTFPVGQERLTALARTAARALRAAA